MTQKPPSRTPVEQTQHHRAVKTLPLESRQTFRWAMAGVGVAGVLVIVVATSRYGVGLSPDSANYLWAAKNLMLGLSLVSADGAPLTSWPPLYPVALAVLGTLGVEPWDGARFLNAVAFGLLIYLTGLTLARTVRSRTLALLGAAGLIAAAPLVRIASTAWTETTFSLLLLAYATVVAEAARTGGRAAVAATCLASAALPMLRYIGAVPALTGAGLLLFSPGRLRVSGRIRRGMLVAACALVPVGAWAGRNLLLTGQPTGPRSESATGALENARLTLSTVAAWMLPDRVVSWGSGLVGIAVAGCAVGAVALFARRRRLWVSGGVTTLAVMLATAASYVIALVVSASVVAYDAIGDRLLSPVYALVAVLGVTALGELAGLRSRSVTRARARRLRRTAVAGVALLVCLLYPALRSVRVVGAQLVYGAGGYNSAPWRESNLIEWFRANSPPRGLPICSNAPDALAILAGASANMSPRRTASVDAVLSSFGTASTYLVWFYGVARPYLFRPDELRQLLDVEPVAAFSDGAVFTVSSAAHTEARPVRPPKTR